MKEDIKPISHYTFRHLNERVTLFGYPPVIGCLLFVTALMLIILSISFKAKILIVLSILYLPTFIFYTIKNHKAVKENRLEILTLLFFESKRTIYIDHDSVIKKIKQ